MSRRWLRVGVLGVAGLFLCGIAVAQNNLYGTLSCVQAAASANPDPSPSKTSQGPANVQVSCSWSEPFLIADVTARDAQGTFRSNVEGNKSQDTADFLIHMNNDDQVSLHFSGTSVLDGAGAARSRQGNWTLAAGTGMFKGISGQGSYTGLPRASGGVTYDLQGTYQLPANTPKPVAPQPAPAQKPAPPANAPKDEG